MNGRYKSLAAIMMMFSSSALAVTPAKLVQPSYWYEDEDVRAVLQKRTDIEYECETFCDDASRNKAYAAGIISVLGLFKMIYS